MELQHLDKLKRNYIENPLKPREKPYKEDIVFLYIDCNLCLQELAKLFNVCQSTTTVSKSEVVKEFSKLKYRI